MAPAAAYRVKKAWRILSTYLARVNRINLAFADQMVVSGANFATGILFARFLGLFEFGRFSLAWIIVEFSASLQYAAILQPMLNIGPKHADSDAGPYYDAALTQQGAFSLASMLLVGGGAAAAARFFPSLHIGDLALPMGIAVAGHQLQFFVRRYFFARERPGIAFAIDICRYAVQLGVTLGLAFGAPFAMRGPNALWIVGGSAMLAAALGACFVGRVSWNRAAMAGATRQHWHFAKWALPSAVMYLLAGQTSMMVAGAVLGAVTVGAMNAAKNILGILNILLLALDNFAPAQASRTLVRAGYNAFRGYLRRLAIGVAALMIGFVTLVNLNPNYLIHLVFGSQYNDLGYLVRWYSAAYLIYGMSTVLVIRAAALETIKPIFISYAAAASIAILFAYPLALLFGVVGVMAGAVLTELVRLGTLLWQTGRGQRHVFARAGVYQPACDAGGPPA
jgi:O-antigen/teichoic acid export membrane protein